MISAEEWYDPHPDPTSYWQGDIVKDVPFFVFPNFKTINEEGKWQLLRPINPQKDTVSRTLEQRMQRVPLKLIAQSAKLSPDWWQDPEGEYFIAHARRMTVMVITRSCAIPRKDNYPRFLVAPITSVDDLGPDQKTDTYLAPVRLGRAMDWFYLPATSGLKESIADLTFMAPVHRSFFGETPVESSRTATEEPDAKGRVVRIASLTANARSKLEEIVSDSIGTIFGFDSTDKSPQAAEYACSRCFYNGVRHITYRRVNAGDVIGQCPNCGALTTWVKMPMGVAEISRPQPVGEEPHVE